MSWANPSCSITSPSTGVRNRRTPARSAEARLAAVPGLQFKLFLAAYLLWRLVADGLKPVRHAYPWGLSGIQWVCLVALAFYLPLTVRQWRRLHVPKEPTLSVL